MFINQKTFVAKRAFKSKYFSNFVAAKSEIDGRKNLCSVHFSSSLTKSTARIRLQISKHVLHLTVEAANKRRSEFNFIPGSFLCKTFFASLYATTSHQHRSLASRLLFTRQLRNFWCWSLNKSKQIQSKPATLNSITANAELIMKINWKFIVFVEVSEGNFEMLLVVNKVVNSQKQQTEYFLRCFQPFLLKFSLYFHHPETFSIKTSSDPIKSTNFNVKLC